jgi:hypothetical protein
MKNTLALRLPGSGSGAVVFNRLLLWHTVVCLRVNRQTRRLPARMAARHPPVPVLGWQSHGRRRRQDALVIRLVEIFRDIGCRPGVVSRDCGGLAVREPRLVGPEAIHSRWATSRC